MARELIAAAGTEVEVVLATLEIASTACEFLGVQFFGHGDLVTGLYAPPPFACGIEVIGPYNIDALVGGPQERDRDSGNHVEPQIVRFIDIKNI